MAKRRAHGEIASSTFNMTINGFELRGAKYSTGWRWVCSWPDLTTKHDGCEDATGIVAEFTNRALFGLVNTTRFAATIVQTEQQ